MWIKKLFTRCSDEVLYVDNDDKAVSEAWVSVECSELWLGLQQSVKTETSQLSYSPVYIHIHIHIRHTKTSIRIQLQRLHVVVLSCNFNMVLLHHSTQRQMGDACLQASKFRHVCIQYQCLTYWKKLKTAARIYPLARHVYIRIQGLNKRKK